MKMSFNRLKNSSGITLIELVTVAAMIGILAIALIGYLRPDLQFRKASDAQKQNDLKQIQTALDTYYVDNGCYPESVPFGQEWRVGNTVYMKKVPNNPCLNNASSCYVYEASGNCPQWNVLFAKLDAQPSDKACNIEAFSSCTPENYSTQWSCATLGEVDCSYMSTARLPLESDTVINPTTSPSTTPGSTITPPTPTPTAVSCPQEQRNYACAGVPSRCNVVPAGTGSYCSSNCEGSC